MVLWFSLERRKTSPRDLVQEARPKDERAISVSGCVHRGTVKYRDRAFERTVIYKRHSRNHLLDQVESFLIGDRGSDREDDLVDNLANQ